jgi:hypothetical protein
VILATQAYNPSSISSSEQNTHMAETTTTARGRAAAPAAPRDAREEADRALRNTVFAPGIAPALCALFLLTIARFPSLQHVVEIRRNVAARRERGHRTCRRPRSCPNRGTCCACCRRGPRSGRCAARRTPGPLAARVGDPGLRDGAGGAVGAERVGAAPVQQALTGLLGRATSRRTWAGRAGSTTARTWST